MPQASVAYPAQPSGRARPRRTLAPPPAPRTVDWLAALALAVAAGLLAAGEPGLDFITSAGYEALMVRPDGTITHSEEFGFARARPMGLDSAQSPQADNPTSNRVISAPIV